MQVAQEAFIILAPRFPHPTPRRHTGQYCSFLTTQWLNHAVFHFTPSHPHGQQSWGGPLYPPPPTAAGHRGLTPSRLRSLFSPEPPRSAWPSPQHASGKPFASHLLSARDRLVRGGERGGGAVGQGGRTASLIISVQDGKITCCRNWQTDMQSDRNYA